MSDTNTHTQTHVIIESQTSLSVACMKKRKRRQNWHSRNLLVTWIHSHINTPKKFNFYAVIFRVIISFIVFYSILLSISLVSPFAVLLEFPFWKSSDRKIQSMSDIYVFTFHISQAPISPSPENRICVRVRAIPYRSNLDKLRQENTKTHQRKTKFPISF